MTTKTFLICYELDQLPTGLKKWHYVREKQRIILHVSARIYKQMKAIKEERKGDLKYRDRLVTDILNDGAPRWWPAELVWEIVNRGTTMND
jgi:hypothetical protein